MNMFNRWEDVKVFNYGSDAYVLQGRKNRLTNRASFKVTAAQNFGGVVNCRCLTEEDLMKAGLWEKENDRA